MGVSMFRSTRAAGRSRVFAAVLAVAAVVHGPAAHAQDLLVFAAASLKNALDEVGAAFTQQTGTKVNVSYAASSALAKQIENKAPANLFISADLDWMDYVAQRQLIRADSRTHLLGNRLVLVAPKDSPATVEIKKGFKLGDLLGTGRLAVGDPAHVPAGKYAKAALEALDAWAPVERKLAPTENVRATLALVARKEAPFGIVYETDAKAEPAVKVVGVFPAGTHPPIIYPVAIIAGSTNPNARPFLDHLTSPAAAAVFGKHGFSLPAPSH